MKKRLLIFDLWFNKNFGWILTNGNKTDRLIDTIAKQEKQLKEWKD